MPPRLDAVIAVLDLTTTTTASDLTSITIDASGTGDVAFDVARVELFRDDGDGVFNPANDGPAVATDVFTQSQLVLALPVPLALGVVQGLPVASATLTTSDRVASASRGGGGGCAAQPGAAPGDPSGFAWWLVLIALASVRWITRRRGTREASGCEIASHPGLRCELAA